jgi:hypothetical protein
MLGKDYSIRNVKDKVVMDFDSGLLGCDTMQTGRQ